MEKVLKGKRILIHTNHFYPETFRVNDVAFSLASEGHEVTVITGIPDYPQGTFYKGYGLFRRSREVVNGVKVVRVPLVPRGKGGSMRLALNYLTYLLSATCFSLWYALTRKYDCIFVHETSPVTVGIPAVLVKKIQRIRLYFWVLDLWPESLEAAGGIHNRTILGLFDAVTRWLYRNSDRILISSRGFRSSICAKGDFSSRIIYFPNWSEESLSSGVKRDIPVLPQGFRIMFAGNIGEAQNFDHILQAALTLKEETEVQWIVIGDGRKRPAVEEFVRRHGLQDTFHLLGRYDIAYMPSFFAEADVMLVSLRDEPIFNLTLPAKVQAYMANHKPILAMMNGEGREIIAEAQCGISVGASDVEGMAAAVRRLHSLPKEKLTQMGENGYLYYEQYFQQKNCLDHLKQIMNL